MWKDRYPGRPEEGPRRGRSRGGPPLARPHVGPKMSHLLSLGSPAARVTRRSLEEHQTLPARNFHPPEDLLRESQAENIFHNIAKTF